MSQDIKIIQWGKFVPSLFLVIFSLVLIGIAYYIDSTAEGAEATMAVFISTAGVFLVLIGLVLVVASWKTRSITEELEKAEAYLAKGQYIYAGHHLRMVALIHKKLQDRDKVRIYYTQALEAYFSSKKYWTFVEVVLSQTKQFVPDLKAQLDIYKEAANKLLAVGEPMRAATLVWHIRTFYEKKPLQDSDKAAYYAELAQQVKAGVVDKIE